MKKIPSLTKFYVAALAVLIAMPIIFSTIPPLGQTAPSQPILTIDTPSPTGTTYISISWTAATGADDYRLYRNNAIILTTTSTGHLDNVPGNGIYTYKVEARNAHGNTFSNEASISVQGPTPAPALFPSNVLTKVISPESTNFIHISTPRIAIDSSNNVHMVWSDNTNLLGSGTDYDIYYRFLNTQTGLAGPLELVSTGNLNEIFPDIAVDPTGKIHVVWWYNDFYNNHIRYRSKSTTWGSVATVINLNDGTTQCYPRIAVGSSIHIVYDDTKILLGSGSDRDIFHIFTDAASPNWGTAPLSLVSIGSSATSNAASIHLYGGVVRVAWQDDGIGGGSDTDIFYNERTVTTWGTPQLVSTTSINSFTPSLTYSPNGVDVVWRESNSIWYSKRTTSWSTPIVVSTKTTGGIPSAPEIYTEMGGGAGFHVVWAQSSNYMSATTRFQVFYKRFIYTVGGGGSGVWSSTGVVSTESSGTWSGRPDLAVGTDSTVHVVWSDNTNYQGAGTDDDVFYKQFKDPLLPGHVISSNAGLAAIADVGSGTGPDPYIIKGFSIINILELSGTTAHVILSDMNIGYTSRTSPSIRLLNAINVRFDNLTMIGDGACSGVVVGAGSAAIMKRSTFAHVRDAIYVYGYSTLAIEATVSIRDCTRAGIVNVNGAVSTSANITRCPWAISIYYANLSFHGGLLNDSFGGIISRGSSINASGSIDNCSNGLLLLAGHLNFTGVISNCNAGIKVNGTTTRISGTIVNCTTGLMVDDGVESFEGGASNSAGYWQYSDFKEAYLGTINGQSTYVGIWDASSGHSSTVGIDGSDARLLIQPSGTTAEITRLFFNTKLRSFPTGYSYTIIPQQTTGLLWIHLGKADISNRAAILFRQDGALCYENGLTVIKHSDYVAMQPYKIDVSLDSTTTFSFRVNGGPWVTGISYHSGPMTVNDFPYMTFRTLTAIGNYKVTNITACRTIQNAHGWNPWPTVAGSNFATNMIDNVSVAEYLSAVNGAITPTFYFPAPTDSNEKSVIFYMKPRTQAATIGIGNNDGPDRIYLYMHAGTLDRISNYVAGAFAGWFDGNYHYNLYGWNKFNVTIHNSSSYTLSVNDVVLTLGGNPNAPVNYNINNISKIQFSSDNSPGYGVHYYVDNIRIVNANLVNVTGATFLNNTKQLDVRSGTVIVNQSIFSSLDGNSTFAASANVTFQGNYYLDYFCRYPFANATSLSKTTLDTEYEIITGVNDTAPGYDDSLFPNSRTYTRLAFLVGLGFTGGDILHVDGVLESGATFTPGHVLFRATVYNTSMVLLYDQIINVLSDSTPCITVQQPANNTTLFLPDTMLIEARVFDADDDVASVNATFKKGASNFTIALSPKAGFPFIWNASVTGASFGTNYGSWQLIINAIDSANNTAMDNSTMFTFANSPPDITNILPAAASTFDVNFTVSAVITDINPSDTIAWARVDFNCTTSSFNKTIMLVAGSGGSYSAFVNIQLMRYGSYTMTIKAADNVGNEATASQAITLNPVSYLYLGLANITYPVDGVEATSLGLSLDAVANITHDPITQSPRVKVYLPSGWTDATSGLIRRGTYDYFDLVPSTLGMFEFYFIKGYPVDGYQPTDQLTFKIEGPRASTATPFQIGNVTYQEITSTAKHSFTNVQIEGSITGIRDTVNVTLEILVGASWVPAGPEYDFAYTEGFTLRYSLTLPSIGVGQTVKMRVVLTPVFIQTFQLPGGFWLGLIVAISVGAVLALVLWQREMRAVIKIGIIGGVSVALLILMTILIP